MINNIKNVSWFFSHYLSDYFYIYKIISKMQALVKQIERDNYEKSFSYKRKF